MQLRKRCSGNVQATLAGLAAGLLAATGARAEDQPGSRVDSGILFYQESSGRVQAIEPAVTGTFDLGEQRTLSVGVVSDTLTGASPNGAVPSTRTQTFVTPAPTHSSTGASGGSTLVVLPPLPGQSGAGTTVRQYSVAPGALPADPGFSDQRYAINLGWAQPIDTERKITFGGSYSTEHDYQAKSATAGIAQDFNSKNTTLNLSLNFESDSSQPIGGTPTPLTVMSGSLKGPNASKTETDVVIGLTQIVDRYWILQLNYQYGASQGYQNDPYRIISLVDPILGQPINQLYENRPKSRAKQSLYLQNKVHVGGDIFNLSARYYRDDWGISSTTLELSDRSTITDGLYVQPSVRWYRQTAASFYRSFLVANQPVPQYASSDTRLGAFDGLSFGVKFGLAIGETGEIDLRGQYYRQTGNAHPSDAFGQLTNQNLFPTLTATSVMLGYSVGF